MCAATPATSLAKFLVLSTTSENIAKKTDKKEVSRHERKTRMNKNGREMKKKGKKGYRAGFKY
jgi:hypothetical protein